MSNNFKTNLSSCVIYLVIAREIFLLKSDCSVIPKVHKLNFSLLSLTYFAKDEQTLKMEDTLYKMDIFRHRPICGLFPLKCQSLRQTFQRIIQTLFFAKHLHRFCCWFYFNETKFQNKSRKFFIIAVDFWVLRNRDDFISYTLSDSV